MFQGFVGERPFFVNTYFGDFSKLDSICQIDPLIFLGSSKEYLYKNYAVRLGAVVSWHTTFCF